MINVILILSAFKSNVRKISPACSLDFKEPAFVVYNKNNGLNPNQIKLKHMRKVPSRASLPHAMPFLNFFRHFFTL